MLTVDGFAGQGEYLALSQCVILYVTNIYEI